MEQSEHWLDSNGAADHNLGQLFARRQGYKMDCECQHESCGNQKLSLFENAGGMVSFLKAEPGD